MKKGILIILVNLIAISAFSQTKNFIDQPYLETRSKVDTLVSPDRIYMQISIAEKDSKGKISVEEQEHKMANKLVELGINLKKQLFLDDAASNFKKYFLRKQNVLKSKTYQLILYDAVSVGKVLTGLESIGISNVEIVKTEYSKIETLKLNLLSKAISKAKKQAEALVKPLNQKVLNAIYISNNTNYINYSLQGRTAGLKMSLVPDKEQLAPVNIDFQKIKVSSEVFVKFKID
ncbi:MAG: SIMPL domain-containing protein [Lutibacter sp.]|uniref:SIMPL domain-containing protein n=1 Tax=Lutibacter sp. TaxID=1925666 RepID=UPI00299E81DC|nr:SIMPL domain-containing protein [Lutibacter sp.]MDX1828735.1 SIMPL domain-containing protein [Lutibacter sp.]